VASKSDCHRHPQLHAHPRTHPRAFSHTSTYTTAYAVQTSIYRKIRDPKRAVMRNLDLEFHYYRYILRQIFNSRECTVQIFVLYSLTYLQGKEGRFFFLLLITWKIWRNVVAANIQYATRQIVKLACSARYTKNEIILSKTFTIYVKFGFV